ncbi:MAG: hypothetical protein ACJ71T_10880 [Actinomycetales bacterium]
MILRRNLSGTAYLTSIALGSYGRSSHNHRGHVMTEAQELARRALQESMDLRDQGHSDD